MLVGVLFVVACSAPTHDSSLSVDQVVKQITQAMDQVQTFRFSYEVWAGNEMRDSGSGVWVAPDRVQGRILGAEVIQIGSTVYGRSSDAARWTTMTLLPETKTPLDSIAVGPIDDPSLTSHEGDRYIVRGFKNIPFAESGSSSGGSYDVSVALSVDKETFLPIEWTRWDEDPLTGRGGSCPQIDGSATGCLRTTVSYSDYDANITVEPPLDD